MNTESTWVGLTTDELDEIDAPIRERGSATIAGIYRAIEAKLREKNAVQGEPVAMEKLLHPVLREGGYLTNGQAWILAEKIASLYTTPPTAPVQEPFCYFYIENGEEFFAPKGAYVPDNAKPLYTSPPPRQPLTDEEIWDLIEQKELGSAYAIARAIEAAHGIKGEA